VRRQNYRDEMDDFGGAGRLAAAVSRYPREFVGGLMAIIAVFSISFNALFLQSGPHPAPIFATQPVQTQETPIVTPLVAPRPAVVQPMTAPEPAMQNRSRLISDIQRELGRRGYYDGAIDGIWGAKTDAATRDFVQATGVKVNAEANDILLRAILSSGAKAQSGRSASAEPVRNDPIAELIAPTKRVLAIQRALADFGYGQIKPSGNYDADTRTAIEKFEQDRRLPVTGEISDRLVRELAAMTGRPLE
jgi:peptidoglycan hydrolase-like protein with peptidoglycan-binding domain